MSTGIGDALRAARRQQGVTLGDAAGQTRIRESYLAALEGEEFNALGGAVYVKGFLRSYAKYLGIDPEPLLEVYREVYEPQNETHRVASAPSVGSSVRRDRQPGYVIAGVIVLLLVIALGIIGLVGGRDDVAEDEPDDGVAPAPVEETEPVEEATPSPTPTPGVDGLEVAVEVTGSEAWIRVVVDGEQVLEGSQPMGFTETYEADEEVALRLGAPEAVTVIVNGEDQGQLGPSGEPVDLTYRADAAGEDAGPGGTEAGGDTEAGGAETVP